MYRRLQLRLQLRLQPQMLVPMQLDLVLVPIAIVVAGEVEPHPMDPAPLDLVSNCLMLELSLPEAGLCRTLFRLIPHPDGLPASRVTLMLIPLLQELASCCSLILE